MTRPALSKTVCKWRTGTRSDEQGFALLEVLVAFLVLAVGLGIILSGISTAVHANGHTMSNLAAMRVAQSRLEAAGIAEKLVIGHRQGVVANRYTWQQTVTPVQIGAAGPAQHSSAPDQAVVKADLTPLWVEVTVRAKDGTVARLAALKMTSESKQ
jgi:general secretion pathway protein I